MTEKVKVWVYKDEENILRPLAGLFQREGRFADYVQDDIDKFMKKREGKMVKAEVVETEE